MVLYLKKSKDRKIYHLSIGLLGVGNLVQKSPKCKQCHHDCHCKEELHSDEYGLCTCDDCKCKKEFTNEDFWKVMSSRFNK